MIIWVRQQHIDNREYTGIGRVYCELISVLKKLGYTISENDPNQRCIEFWIGGLLEPKKIKDPCCDNILLCWTTGESLIREMPNYGLYDHFIVMTRYFQKLQDVKVPVSVCPLGINPDILNLIVRNNHIFTFAHLGAANYRKGSHIVCMAFDREFYNNENVLLHMISPGASTELYMLEELYRHNVKIKFEIINVEYKKLYLLYQDDCLVFPSIREGWGLILTEAMATGMPAIVSKNPVLEEQFSIDFGWLIDPSNKVSPIGGFIPDVISLRKRMREAFENPLLAIEKGAKASKIIRESLTWENNIKRNIVPILNLYESIISN